MTMSDPDELNNALKRAMRNGEIERAIELVQAGAPVSYMDIRYAVSVRMVPVVAAMAKACRWTLGSLFELHPSLEIAQILLETGRVELDEALAGCVTGPREVAELLVRCGARPDAMIKGASCLHHAISKGSVETYEWLLSLGVTEEPKAGESLMHLAHTVEMIRFLAKRGHPIDEVDAHGQTPLHRVASHDACAELERLGADPSRRDAQGHTPGELLGLAFEAENSKPH